MRILPWLALGALTVLTASCRGPATPNNGAPAPLGFGALPALSLPYVELQAEDATGSGVVSTPSTTLHDPGAEASGRRYVTLAPGAHVDFVVPSGAAGSTGLVVRYSYPDTPDGVGQDGTLTLSVDTSPAGTVALTSRYSWVYGNPNWDGNTNGTNDWPGLPSSGLPRHVWDEAHLRLASGVAAGSTVTLTNPPASPQTVLVDLIDLEVVSPAVPAPPWAQTFHADTTGATDVTGALQNAINAAQGGVLYLPEGTYQIGSVDVGATRLQGAGLWRTQFVGLLSRFHFTHATTSVADFAVFGQTNTRNDKSDEGNAFSGNPGPGSTVARIWIEHKKCGFWVGEWGTGGPDGLRITACRIRDTMADGVNLCSGTTNTVVDNCQFRNTGDDALAAWSPNLNGNPVGGHNTFADNLVQVPWLANGLALYGGGPFVVWGNTVEDTVTTGSGLYVAASFSAWPFTGTTEVDQNTFVRTGAHESDAGSPARTRIAPAGDRDMTGGTFVFTANTVVSPLESAVSILGPHSVGSLVFTGLSVQNLGSLPLVDVRSDAWGSATFSQTTTPGASGPAWNNASVHFTLTHP